jgi:ribonuclease P protein component
VGLPRQHRLKKRRDFQVVYQLGIRRSSPNLILRAFQPPLAPEQLPAPTKIGISIGQKVSKKAVIRNRIKRQIRAVFRELLPQIENGWLIVIVVKSSAVECNYQHFLQELKQLFTKAEICHGY